MGGNGSGRHRGDNSNEPLIQAIDEARWRLIAARDHLKDCRGRFYSAYHSMQAAVVEIEEAANDLACLQRSLGDTELIDRETQRTEEMTVTTPAALVAGLAAAVAESKQVNGILKAAVERATG